MTMIAGAFGHEPWWFDAVIAALATVAYVAYRFTGGELQNQRANRIARREYRHQEARDDD